MSLDARSLAEFVTEETGLPFTCTSGFDAEKNRWLALEPEGHAGPHTFVVRIRLLWRRIEISFEPGKFAGELLQSMAAVDHDGRSIFASVMRDCAEAGANLAFRINGADTPYQANAEWSRNWSRLSLSLTRGNLELGAEDGAADDQIIREWTARFMAAVVALLPLEESDTGEPDVGGYPEGALMRIEVNRYERDRRNRSAALAIHGRACKGCGMSFEERYGAIAAGFIEVHHITPVSNLTANYVINPQTDLVPLCPNCHAVVHRQTPPISIEELSALVKPSSGQRPA